MSAEFFEQSPRPAAPVGLRPAILRGGRFRRVHRWVAAVFTAAVALNFTVMAFGPPPAWITYAPLAPLLFLMLTGLVMLVGPWFGARPPLTSAAAL